MIKKTHNHGHKISAVVLTALVSVSMISGTAMADPNVPGKDATTSASSTTTVGVNPLPSNVAKENVDLAKYGYKTTSKDLIGTENPEKIAAAVGKYKKLWGEEQANANSQVFTQDSERLRRVNDLLDRISKKNGINNQLTDGTTFKKGTIEYDRAHQIAIALQLSYDDSKWDSKGAKWENQRGFKVNGDDVTDKTITLHGKENPETSWTESVMVLAATGGSLHNAPALDTWKQDRMFRSKDFSKVLKEAGANNKMFNRGEISEFNWLDKNSVKAEMSKYMQQAAWIQATDRDKELFKLDKNKISEIPTIEDIKALAANYSISQALKEGKIKLDDPQIEGAVTNSKTRGDLAAKEGRKEVAISLASFVNAISKAKNEIKTSTPSTSTSEESTLTSKPESTSIPKKTSDTVKTPTSKASSETTSKEAPDDSAEVITVPEIVNGRLVVNDATSTTRWNIRKHRSSKDDEIVDKVDPKKGVQVIALYEADKDKGVWVESKDLSRATWIKVKTDSGKIGYMSSSLIY